MRDNVVALEQSEHNLPDDASAELRLLLIDDDPADLQLCKILVRQWDTSTHIVTAESIPEAKAEIDSGSFDCVVLDYHVGEITAEVAIQDLRTAPGTQHTPIVVLSGHGDESKAARALTSGANDYLTKNRLTAEALHRSVTNSIEKAVLARTLEQERDNLMLANEELRRKSREIQSFYHTVSHELKTPITAIREFSSLIRDGILGSITEQQKDALDTTIRCSDRLTCLINDLFDAARIETGKLSLNLHRSDIAGIVDSNIEMMRASAADKDIEIAWQPPTDIPSVDGDANRLGQVICNLLSNAIKFTDAGGKIEVEMTLPDADHVAVSVADNGWGISADHAELIFDRLYQASEETLHSQNGMGIGLYLSKQIINMHGGTITVDSQLGEGSTFLFTLPLAANDCD